MSTLYLECKMGAAGDMLAAALIGLVDDKEQILAELNEIGVPNVEYRYDVVQKCGIYGGHLSVLINGQEEVVLDGEGHDHQHHHHEDDHEHEHHHDHHSSEENHEHHHQHEHSHRSLYDIEEIIENLSICKEIKSDIREIYELLAEAESKVHGVPVSQIHFHEVGNIDAIADIAAVCYLMHVLDPDNVIVSSINVGGGTVRSAHGIIPVPAPATAVLLSGIPTYESKLIQAELCTPTGAALIKYFADSFSVQPVMAIDKIGYGMGKKDFPQVNAVRAMIGNVSEDVDRIIELSCNMDDMTPEEIGFATERLFAEGALDVYTISVAMKKNRPGILLSCMCKEEDRDKMLHIIFKNTTTLGVREHITNRYVLTREISKISTAYGDVRVKRAYGYNVKRSKLEYDDLAGIAIRTGKSIMDLKTEIEETE